MSICRCAELCAFVHVPTPPHSLRAFVPRILQNEPTAAILAVSDMPVRRIIKYLQSKPRPLSTSERKSNGTNPRLPPRHAKPSSILHLPFSPLGASAPWRSSLLLQKQSQSNPRKPHCRSKNPLSPPKNRAPSQNQ